MAGEELTDVVTVADVTTKLLGTTMDDKRFVDTDDISVAVVVDFKEADGTLDDNGVTEDVELSGTSRGGMWFAG